MLHLGLSLFSASPFFRLDRILLHPVFNLPSAELHTTAYNDVGDFMFPRHLSDGVSGQPKDKPQLIRRIELLRIQDSLSHLCPPSIGGFPVRRKYRFSLFKQ
jgi:hypothetical protein